jgi:hypothetical protein
MGRRIGRYIGKNRQVDNDDIRQEFLIGVAKHIEKARLDMGDPIEFLISKGVYAVRSYMRKHIVQGTMQICQDCGHKTRLNRVGNDYICRACGSANCTTQEVNDYDEITMENLVAERFEDDSISSGLIMDFEKTLQPGTNVYNLYMLLKEGVDRDNPDVRNYIKEIARMWGGCSDQNVVQNLDKLKKRMTKWMEQNGLSIKNGTLQCLTF